MAVMGGPRMGARRLGLDESITKQKVKSGTVRRIVPYAMRYRWSLLTLMLLTATDAVMTSAGPLLLKSIIDDGVQPGRTSVVVGLSLVLVGLALAGAVVGFTQTWFSGRVGEGVIYDLRCKVFNHVQQQPIAFFTRAQTGSLVSRLNTDVIGAQQAVTMLLTQTVSTVLTLVLALATMFYLSWQITLAALVVIPVFLLPAKMIGRTLQRLTRERMQLNADMSSMMNERFNVAGAMLIKLYGRSAEEAGTFAGKAGRVRSIAITAMIWGRMLFTVTSLLAALTGALVYGLGGLLAIDNRIELGTLVAMAALLTRIYNPINQLSSMHVNVMNALVSFDRVFEVLDLKPLIAERPGARALPRAEAVGQAAPEIEFDAVEFRYPTAEEVSLASLESIARRMPERSGDAQVLKGLSFVAPAGGLTALVGPSGAGKTTITHLVPRLYDPSAGAVRIGGQDLRDLTLESLHDTVGVVTQDAHMFHDTIRVNLLFARPDATEQDLIEACDAARIWKMISSLPDGLDTVVGDSGYRLSGGEKQRVALARLLLKSPSIVVLDEATAHLDSESEAAIQLALKTALTGRTSIVIAHRLSTIQEADQILVIDDGQVRERGVHDELLASGGLYAELYRTQFRLNGRGDPPRPGPDDRGDLPRFGPGGRGGDMPRFGPGGRGGDMPGPGPDGRRGPRFGPEGRPDMPPPRRRGPRREGGE